MSDGPRNPDEQYATDSARRLTLIEQRYKGTALSEDEQRELHDLQASCATHLDRIHPGPPPIVGLEEAFEAANLQSIRDRSLEP